MRIVHVITALGQGGAEAMLEKLVRVARRANPEIEQEVVSLGSLGTVGERLRSQGIRVTPLHVSGPLSLLVGVRRLRARLRGSSEVVVQTWLYHADVVGGLVARAAGVDRVFWNLRQTLVRDHSMKLVTRVMCRLGAWLSGAIPRRIVCCAESARRSHIAAGYRADRCVVIDNGFDTNVMRRSEEGRARLRDALAIGDAEFLIGVVGRLDPAKDHENFLRAAADVAASVPGARFVLVGRGVDADTAILDSIEAKGLKASTRLLGQQRDVAAVMSALDILVVSSRWEGFPNVLGEAMACETPCVTTDAGDARRIVGDDRFVVPVADPQALARAIMALCQLDGAARRTLGRGLRERIARDFSIETTWEHYRRLYCDA
jgi:glycosyltransferase involved in cell wall biosynthesis